MNNKRETLKRVAGVSAVVALAPTSWTKPALNSVVLPAHAQTSNNLPPLLDSIADVTIDDNGGNSLVFIAQPAGQNIDPNASWGLNGNPLGSLGIEASGGRVVWLLGDVVGTQSAIVSIFVENPDGQRDSTSFRVTVRDSA